MHTGAATVDNVLQQMDLARAPRPFVAQMFEGLFGLPEVLEDYNDAGTLKKFGQLSRTVCRDLQILFPFLSHPQADGAPPPPITFDSMIKLSGRPVGQTLPQNSINTSNNLVKARAQAYRESW